MVDSGSLRRHTAESVSGGSTKPTSSAVLHGIGNTTTYFEDDGTSPIFLEYRLRSTSAVAQGMYLRLKVAGAAATGNALRAYTNVDDVAAANAYGGHISLSFETSGHITGLGCAVRATLHVPVTSTSFGGTVTAVQAEIYGDGTGNTLANTTEHSNIRLVNGGNADSIASHTTWMAFVGSNAANVVAGTVGGTAKGIRIVIDGVVHYITAGTTCS